MSQLAENLEALQDTQAALAMLEKALANGGDLFSVSLSIRSVQKRKEELEAQFLQLTNESHLDVCSYRIFSEANQSFKISSITATLLDFQNLFSIVFDALKNGPKNVARLDVSVANFTALDFGFTFPGSLGVVLTLPNERLLFGESELDQAMQTVFEMAQSHDSAQIAQFAKQLGTAPVRKLYRWVDDLLLAGLGVEVKWQRDSQIKSQIFLQTHDLSKLKDAIATTSEETEENITFGGILWGMDMATRRFHFEVEGLGDIRGEISPKIGTKLTAELGAHYTADVRVKKVTHFATDTDEVSYFILNLHPLAEKASDLN